MAGKIKKYGVTPEKTLSIVLAAVNGVNAAAPLAMPLTAVLTEERQLSGNDLLALSHNRGGQLLNSLFFTTAYAETLSMTTKTISSGTTATGDVILYGGWQIVSSGGSVTDTTVNGGGVQSVNGSGSASDTTINSGGRQYVSSGGSATDTTVNGGGLQDVYGSATNTLLNGSLVSGVPYLGTQRVYSSGSASNTTINSGGCQEVQSGGSATGSIVSSGGTLKVSSGGHVIGAELQVGYVLTADTGATLEANSGGVTIQSGRANNLTLNRGASFSVLLGHQAVNTTVNSGGVQFVSSGGSAVGTMVNSHGWQMVSSGGNAFGTIVNGGIQDVFGSASNTLLSGIMVSGTAYAGDQYIYNSGRAVGTTINDGGRQIVSSGGSATDTTINSGGQQMVSSGGSATGSIVSPNGHLIVSSGGSVTNAQLQAGYVLTADTGATLEANSGGVTIQSGRANNVTLNSGANLSVLSGHQAVNTTVNRGGMQYVSSGGSAVSTTINSGGWQIVSSGGSAASTMINSGGGQIVSSGGSATSTTVNSGGQQIVSNGGSASNATINSGGMVLLDSGAVLGGMTQLNGGKIILNSYSGMYTINRLIVTSGTIDLASFTADRQLTLQSLTGNANFIISTDLANSIADQIHIAAATAGQHTLKVEYDPGFATGEMVTGSAVFATVPDSGTVFRAVDTDFGAYRYTPLLSVSADGSTWSVTGLKADGASETMHTALDAAAGSLALSTVENNNLTKRMGDLRSSTGQAGDWVRFFRGRQEMHDPGTGRSSTQQYNAIQGGHDTKRVTKDGTWYHGYAVSYLSNEGSEVRGKSNGDSYTLGVYASWLGNKGHYLDIIAKQGRQHIGYDSYLNNTANTKVTGAYDNWYSSLSTEYGYRKFITPEFYIEPQAELSLGHASAADYKASDGTAVHNHSVNSVIGRLGLEIGRKNKTTTYYLKTSLLREFSAVPQATMSTGGLAPVTLEEDIKQSWFEFNLGLTGKLSRNTDGYVEFTRTNGERIKTPWQVNAGMRVNF